MMAGVLSPNVTKEVRALLPIWSSCLLIVGAGVVSADYRILTAGVLAYGFGCVALGAQSMGHEYSYRTLGLLLSQPAERRRLWLTKFGVLAAMIGTLSALTALTLVDEFLTLRASRTRDAAIIYVAAAGGLFLAPYLAMLCRSALAAIVFTVGVPGLLLISGDILGMLLYGLDRAGDIDRFTFTFFWRGMFVILALAAIAGWHRFTHLEAIDGHGARIYLPAVFSRRHELAQGARATRRHPLWTLALKELRLQQLTFVVVILYVVLWVVPSTLQSRTGGISDFPLNGLTFLYVALLSMLIGSLASAEERQFGTLEWQILQPVSAERQWAVKVSVALGLALLLGIALPASVRYLSPAGAEFRLPGDTWRLLGVAIVVITSGALYISTLSSSGVRALAVCFPVGAGVVIIVRQTFLILDWMSTEGLIRRPGRYVSHERMVLILVIAAAGLVALALRFGFRNHRSSDRGVRTILAQAGWLVGYLVLGTAGFYLAMASPAIGSVP